MSMTKRNKPSTNTAATVTFDGVDRVVHQLDSIQWSYVGGSLSGGNIKVDSPSGTTIWELDVAAAGPNSVVFRNGLRGAEGQAIVVTLAAGGADVQGIVNATKV